MKEIFERRSVRSFTDREVEKEKIEMLLRAAMQSPTGGDQREWHFVVVTDRETLNKLGDCSAHAASTKTAPVVIVPCADMSKCMFPELWEQDLGASAQNILLEGFHLGLGCVWQAVAPYADREEAVKKVLKLPDNIRPFAFVSVGYSDNIPPKEDRFDKSRVHLEKWR